MLLRESKNKNKLRLKIFGLTIRNKPQQCLRTEELLSRLRLGLEGGDICRVTFFYLEQELIAIETKKRK